MKIYNIVLTLILFCAYNASFGQPIFPDDGVVFNDNIVSRVDITINPDTLEWLYDNVESYQEFHATFLFTTDGVIETVENIGFRLRGNTSRYSGKKSFKVSFNTFEPGRKWHGLEKMNLNGEHNDPSVSRSKICWDLLKDFGIAAPRSNHVELYINGNYHGLYLNVEHIDEEFVESRFGNKDGNLYKCLYPADLDFMGSNPELYKENLYGRRTYDLKTNTAYDDYSDLAHFIDVLNNTTPGNDFICEMEKVFNIYDYLKIIVIDIYTANWDGYIYNKNNFYLYHNTETGKFEYINYDMDNTLGIDWMGKDWATRDVYDWEQHGDNVRPLYTRIMANPELKDQYSVYFRQFLEQIIDSDINNRINALRDKIAPYIINDPFYPLDYGFSYSDFISSFEESFGAHVKYGIKPYLADRKTSALSQLSNPDMKPVIKYIKHGHPLPGEDLWVNAFIEDEDTNPEVKISYTLNGGALQNVLMYDDGNHEDGSQNDGFYGGVIYNVEMNSSIAFRVKAIDQFGQVSALPCDPIIIEFYPSEDPDLVINEFMASNLTTVADEFDEFDDWIEIFNKGTESVWLGDKFLSDNISNP
ncbi:MAG: CotH kinase family protein, partial [Bacteroidales bacterium]|nr:CotH kinase family protein [Bacteroidales bacterium]